MRRHLPPLSTLRLFEAAARHLSFKNAAEELLLTPSAVSHGIQVLEDWLQKPLFVRTSRGLQLSDAGKSYYPAVRDALALLAEGTEALAHREPSRRLSLSVAPTFAARWLLPRLPSFRRSYPHIGIVIDTSHERIDLNGGADLAIRMGRGSWQGLSAHRLLEEALVPVAAPSLKAQAHDVSQIEETAFIHVVSISQDWEAWASAAGHPVPDPAKGLRVDTVHMALSAAIEGLGVAIGRRPLIDRDLNEGRLVELARAVPSGTSYWLVAEESRSDEPGIAAFRDWIMAEAAASPRQVADGTPSG